MSQTTSHYYVLFIAPYPGLAQVVREVAPNFPELSITVHEGDLSAGVYAALSSIDANFDVVVSRGGTAQLLQDEFATPVVEVGISVADLYACLTEHNPTGRRTAIVGFDNALEPLKDVVEFSDFDLDILTVSFEDELPLVLEKIAHQNYDVVLCDTFSLPRCKEMGLNAYLLSSGPQSVSAALGHALEFCEREHDLLSRNRMLWSLIAAQDANFAIFGQDQRLTYCNISHRREELVAFMRDHLASRQDERLVFERGHHIYRLHKVPVESDGESFTAFAIMRSSAPSSGLHSGIDRQNCDDVQKDYRKSVYCHTQANTTLAAPLVRAIGSERPVLLEGKPSTGKVRIAQLIYLSGKWTSRPFVTIDCHLVTDKSWGYLTSSTNSPLYGTELTLFFNSIECLGNERLRRLLDILRRSGVVRRDHLIVSISDPTAIDSETMDMLYDCLHFHQLNVPALSQRPDLEQAIILFLNTEASSADAVRPTVTDEAIEVLTHHDWPGNYAEFTLVMQRCIDMAQGGRITASVARRAIKTHAAVSVGATSSSQQDFNLMRPLHEIQKDIVSRVIDSCGGNQTEAARTLGISRTTIWRITKD